MKDPQYERLFSLACKRSNTFLIQGAVLLSESEADISSAIKLATEFQLDVAVRGGGHSHWDASSSDGGLVIDLSKMNKVTVDVGTKTAVVQGGALWHHVDEALGKHSLAAVGGYVRASSNDRQ